MAYKELKNQISNSPRRWLITGVAGFIGSHLLEELLKLGQEVIGIDDFSTGNKNNLEEVKKLVTKESWQRFSFYKGDICCFDNCKSVVKNVDYVLHQAALGSVPRSVNDPISTNATNIDGFLNILEASRLGKVKSFTFAASSSTYGDHPDLPKKEKNIGNPLSPYAVTKLVNEIYAGVYFRTYGFKSIGLRYFNVFGSRQDPEGAYAAVIPQWTQALIKNEDVFINGDGHTSRDFCYIDNVVQANLLAAIYGCKYDHDIFNVAVGSRTSLNELYVAIKNNLKEYGINNACSPIYRDFRTADVRHSQASIKKITDYLGYKPIFNVEQGLELAMPWYIEYMKQN